jgi:hypothetical protein
MMITIIVIQFKGPMGNSGKDGKPGGIKIIF